MADGFEIGLQVNGHKSTTTTHCDHDYIAFFDLGWKVQQFSFQRLYTLRFPSAQPDRLISCSPWGFPILLSRLGLAKTCADGISGAHEPRTFSGCNPRHAPVSPTPPHLLNQESARQVTINPIYSEESPLPRVGFVVFPQAYSDSTQLRFIIPQVTGVISWSIDG